MLLEPMLPLNRTENYFKDDDILVFYVGENPNLSDVFVLAKLNESHKKNDPRILHLWEYQYLLENKDFAKEWAESFEDWDYAQFLYDLETTQYSLNSKIV
jgi:hypothetical protein